MYLETERLSIRSISPNDEQAFIEMASDGSLTEIFGDCSECDKWMGEFISEAIQLEKENNPYREYLAYAIVDKRKHQVIGSVGSSYYEDFSEIGITYFIGTKFRGNGYAAEAVEAFVMYFFENYDVTKIIATAGTENKASCKTLERAGFVLQETKMYQDLYNEKEEMNNLYEIIKCQAQG